MDELSDQELQFLQTLREQTGNVDFSVLIARRAALWTITLSHTVGSKLLVDLAKARHFLTRGSVLGATGLSGRGWRLSSTTINELPDWLGLTNAERGAISSRVIWARRK